MDHFSTVKNHFPVIGIYSCKNFFHPKCHACIATESSTTNIDIANVPFLSDVNVAKYSSIIGNVCVNISHSHPSRLAINTTKNMLTMVNFIRLFSSSPRISSKKVYMLSKNSSKAWLNQDFFLNNSNHIITITINSTKTHKKLGTNGIVMPPIVRCSIVLIYLSLKPKKLLYLIKKVYRWTIDIWLSTTRAK